MRWLLVLVTALAALTAPAVQAADSPYSHQQHAPLKYPCAKCHVGTGDAARFPPAAACQVCHPGREFPVFPTQRVYRLPDVIIFSHARHASAKVACGTCHGDVTRTARLKVEMATSMKACVDCHKKGGATTVCAACHELGQ